MTINILGEQWTIEEHYIDDDELLKEHDGYCDVSIKQIVIEKEMLGELKNMDNYRKKVLRHEIIHAFLFESGLRECSYGINHWAESEEMIDWIANQGLKIYKAWQEAGAI